MGLQDIEMTIFNCPYTASKECDARLSCHPIPGCGPLDPEFIVLGINPARRGGVWSRYDCLEELKHRYLIECKKPQYSYGKFLGRLERLVPQFRIPQTVYLTDIVRCPTRQGLPPSGMIEQCVSAYMKKTLQVLHPQYIISLGRHPSIYVGGFFSGNVVRSRRIKIDEHDYWVIAVPHPSRANAEAIASTVSQIIDEPRSGFAVESGQVSYLLKNEEMGNVTMRKLMDLGYKKMGRSSWIKESQVVKVVRSSEFRRRIRIRWEEEWKDNHAIITITLVERDQYALCLLMSSSGRLLSGKSGSPMLIKRVSTCGLRLFQEITIWQDWFSVSKVDGIFYRIARANAMIGD